MNKNIRKIFIISILVICVVAINLAVYFQITQKPKEEKKEELEIDTAFLEENFESIFDNIIDYQGNNLNIAKEKDTEDLIYTNYKCEQKLENSYDLNVSIPYLNINSEEAKVINEEINNLFYNKAINVLAEKNKFTIYSVKYKAYVNDNIVSLVIMATLKEGENSQRVIIKTYNYNLSSNSRIQINQILQYRNISTDYAQRKINEAIKVASQEASRYNELGYNKYLRDINNDMYKLQNTTIFFIGQDKAVYIIYPYGNLNYTSEFDLLVI